MWFISSNYGDSSEPLVVSQGCQVSFLIAKDTLGFFTSCDRGIGTHLMLKRKCQCPFPGAKAIIRFAYIFQGSTPSSHGEAWKTSSFSSSKWGVRPHFKLGRGTCAFSRSAKRESDVP